MMMLMMMVIIWSCSIFVSILDSLRTLWRARKGYMLILMWQFLHEMDNSSIKEAGQNHNELVITKSLYCIYNPHTIHPLVHVSATQIDVETKANKISMTRSKSHFHTSLTSFIIAWNAFAIFLALKDRMIHSQRPSQKESFSFLFFSKLFF